MNLRREFLGIGRPPLELAADYLLQRYVQGTSADMGRAIVVLPASRAVRRLLEILVERAERRALQLTPPRIETVGNLPEQLYPLRKPPASDLVQRLAWAEVLHTAPPAQLAGLLSSPPPADDRGAWLELGQLLARQHTELAADGLNFADVARLGPEVEGFAEAARWQSLHAIQDAYLRLLDELGLWDIQTARLVAVRQQECATDRDIFLVGAVDINKSLRQMLEQVAERVTVFVFAPVDWADRFDEHGCLLPDVWSSVPLPVRTEQVHVVDGPAEQADMAARCLASYEGRYRPDEITIGLTDEQILPHVQRQLEQCQLASRSAAGVPVAQSALYRLLDAAADYLERGRTTELAALVRHPDVHEWLERQRVGPGWLEQLDQYWAEHLQTELGEEWLGAQDEYNLCRSACRRVAKLVGQLGGSARAWADWAEPIRGLLLAIYGERTWDREVAEDRVQVAVFEAVHEVLETPSGGSIPLRLMPTVTGAEALRLMLQQLETSRVAAPIDPAAIELLGWLELPWDDAPALVVTTFNEGWVPASVNSDLFLPNALRVRLGLQDNARRYARDAYALSVLLATRERLDLIVARRNSEGDPLPPSRLLFATDAETLASRALAWFKPPPARHELPPLAGRLTAGHDTPAFPVPRPEPLPTPLRELRVTAFRDYLACPYRFYLRHVLKLQSVADAGEELDGGAFGGLLHDVLHDFGEGRERDSTEPGTIRGALFTALDRCVAERYGRRPPSSVRVQVEQLRARLSAFADQQAAWAASGWRIEKTEVSVSGPLAALDVDGQPFYLRGRIDRIDFHPEKNERFIWDYKSSDAGKTPEQVHRRSGEWVDLQLPLYRHLLPSLGITGPVRLGYILLPKDTASVQFCEAEWTTEDLHVADDVARDVIRQIRAERFWPPAMPPPDFSEEFAAICQDGVFEKDLA